MKHLLTRSDIQAIIQRAWQRLTLDGRLRITQPWACLIGPIALVLALIAPYAGLFVIAYAYLLLTIGMYLWVREVGPRIRLQRQLKTEWAQVGDDLEEHWQLANTARLPLLWVEIADASSLPGYTGRRVAALSPGAQQHWLTSARCERRGVYTLGPLAAATGDPFGLFRYQWHEGSTRQIVIYPPLVQLPPLIVPQGQRGGLARADLLQQYVTPSVGGLREYVQGDPPSHVHWPTVARTDRLMVKQFDQERAGALWIALDLQAEAYRSDHLPAAPRDQAPLTSIYTQTSAVATTPADNPFESSLELAIVLACSLASQALSEGRSVGLLADNGQQRLVTPGRGPRQLWRILSALVDVQASGALPLGTVIRQGQTARASEIAGSALAVVTPALDGAWLPALANWQHGRSNGALALLVTPRAALAQPLEMRLAASGITAQAFVLGTRLPLLNPPKARDTTRISPLGKVVRGE